MDELRMSYVCQSSIFNALKDLEDDRATSVLDSVPRHIEQAISHVDKKSKEFEKDDGGQEKFKAMLLQNRSR
jgi:hypothetical protein